MEGFHLRRGSRLGIIAPREGAKSTWLTLAYVLRMAVEGREPHIVILALNDDDAGKFLMGIRLELETNERLRAVYADACTIKASEWRTDRLRLANGVLIQALGRGSNIRGHKDRQHRPSLVVVDDCQNNKAITQPLDRERTQNWFLQEVIPAGSDRTNFISVGSAIHREALAVYVQKLPGWTGRTFQAVLEWPLRMDLWDQWERLATNLADPNRNETADAFLNTNRTQMLRGGVSFWPAYKPIDVLMKRRAEIGHARFNTEYQGVPGTLEGTEWPGELFDWPGFWFDDWPQDLAMKLQSLDPSKGRTDKADYQAHVMIGLARDGTFYLDCELRKEPDWCRRALDLAARWHPRELVAEANNTMGLALPEFMRLIAERPATTYRPTIHEVNNTEPKVSRIRVLSTYLQRRQIRVRNTVGGRMLVEQLRDFPNGEYDDGPDAAATGIIRMQELYHNSG